MTQQNPTSISSQELQIGFQQLQQHPFFRIYYTALKEKYETAIQMLATEGQMTNEQLHTLRGIISAYKTALNLPLMIVNQVQTAEAIEAQKAAERAE